MPKYGTDEYLRIANANARKLGDFSVKYSNTGKKKLDVFKKDKKIADIGHKDYSDFIQHGSEIRRQNYHKRFAKTAKVKFSNSYFAKNILW
jgi:ribosomal protein L7/L12